MKPLTEYLGIPGFYLTEEQRLLVINDEGNITFISGNIATQELVDPSDWNVEPVSMKRFYVTKKPVKRQMIKINPLNTEYPFVGILLPSIGSCAGVF